jgi:polysaccharide biosynthesis transport protein
VNVSIDEPSALGTYLDAARHRRKTVILTFSLSMLVAILLALLWPPTYRSSGTILIEQQEMPQELVRSTVTSYADQRVQVISKRVMTTETMLGIIHRYGLYPKQVQKDTREALLNRMRKDIGLKMISADVIDPRSGRPTEATIAFEVSYTSGSAETAAKVANELTSLYLNENLNNRTQLARDATVFLEAEGDHLSARIGELEAALEKFKQKNFQQLPEVTQLNMTLLDRTEEELRSQESRRDSLNQQRTYLEAQLAQLKPNSAMFSDNGERIMTTYDRLRTLKSELASDKAKYAPDHPDIARLEREIAGLEADPSSHPPGTATSEASETVNELRRKLDKAQADLAAAREKYSPEHPDRVRLEREVPELQKELAAVPPAPAVSDAPVPHVDADNPAYVQIQAALAATANDLKALDAENAKLHAKADQLTHDVRLAPQVEQEYRELTRDYDNSKMKYQELRLKQAEAKTAQNLEADRKGERFTLIEPPLPPEEPASPNRPLIVIAGFVLSLGLAFGLLWLLENGDTSVRNRIDLLKLTGIPPLALVPHIDTETERRSATRRVRLAVGSVMATAFAAVAMVHFFYRPLDVLWFTLTRRFGL